MSTSEITARRLTNMAWIPGGTFLMGSNDFYPEERPVHHVFVDGFWMDEHPVTVAEFRRFVRETSYVTLAESAPEAAMYPDADPELLVPGSVVFRRSRGPVDLLDHHNWWGYIPGAHWRHPDGPESSLAGRDRHPVTQLAYVDVLAYTRWAGKELPSEAEWEFACRGGLEGAVYAWGDEFEPRGRSMANTWQGEFPWQNLRRDGYEGTSPVGAYRSNGYGLHDMTGNVWEWTADLFTPQHPEEVEHACCVPHNPRVERQSSGDGLMLSDTIDPAVRRVIKGGSHLCAPNYCLRYRPAARQGQDVDTGTSHLGFRCIIRP